MSILCILLSFQAFALDYPHNGINNIGCDSCHFVYGSQPSLLPPWTSHNSQNIDDTQYNTLCWSCHNDIEAPYMRTHSSLQTDTGYGYWTIECKTCHNPHTQDQVRTYTGSSHLYSGTSTGITATTLTKSGAGWTDDEYEGRVLIPNTGSLSRLKYGYKITGNTGDTITVEGPIDLSKASVGDTFAVIYGKLIRSTITLDNIIDPSVTKEGDKTVRFFNSTGTNSFADGDAVYDGVCEVCHTETTYHTNDGVGTSHNEAADCTRCHSHLYGFAHGLGGGASSDCEECHGHDAGYEYQPGEYSLGVGSYISHSTHTENDADDMRGPNIECVDCHETGGFPYFRSGTDSNGDGRYALSETDVCDTCHSPGGSYDGVNDAVIGAKNNWSGIGSSVSPVYEGDGSLKSGRKKWCAGCHDEVPSVIQSISAPNVIGDEDQNTAYGIGYGFYKTGHGLPHGLYPATGAPAANKGCLDCHDSTTAHIDGEHRTYLSANDNYQAGYRLKDVSGGAPMDIPLSASRSVDDFALCFQCHDSDIYTNRYNYTTNFRSDTTAIDGITPVNSHWYHLLYSRPWADWDSDWDGATGDSLISCPACHNVHGSPSPAMYRHGELISTPGTTDKVPALDFKYTPTGNSPTLAGSSGGVTRFIAPGPGSIAKNGVCNMCHYDAMSYTRAVSDMYPPRISFVSGEVDSDVLVVTFSEPVYSDTGATGNLTAADFLLTDADDGRTISGVTHTAGDMVAFLTLSDPLDPDNDIGVDALAAATTSSIYDASGNAMATTPAVISGDSVAPSISSIDPADGEVDIALNEDLTFTLTDSDSGIDWTTFSIQLSGDLGYDRTYTAADTEIVSKAGTPSVYWVTVDPDIFYGSGEVITVTLNVDDLAGNSLTLLWSFTTASAAIWGTPDSLHDSVILEGATNLIDEDLATGNGFSAGGPDHYGTYELASNGDLYDVTAVRIYGGPTYTRSWRVYVSRDGLVYTYMGAFSVGGASQWYEYTFPSTETVRYIRINAWHPGPESAEVAFEFQFKGTPVVNNNNAPSLSWTGEAGYTTDGVDPDSAIGGTDFEFRVEYTDTDNNPPAVMQVWVDINDNDSYASTEKYAMTEADAGDTDYTDGKLYTLTKPLLYAGDGEFNYRFAASDGTDPATESPTIDRQVFVTNNVPVLAWTGETNYTDTGVYPDNVLGGNSFEFRISYSDVDNTAPSTIQVWIDKNDNNTPDPGETYDMNQVDTNDTDYTDGKLYSTTMTLGFAGDGELIYRFNASDGTADAAGDPTTDSIMTVINNVPVIAWAGETHYTTDGVYPDTATSGNSFEFRISYSDIDNTAPGSIQVWVDEDDSGTYEAGEKYDMTELDSGDTVLTDGKFYSKTIVLDYAGDGNLNYRFYASDGTDDAVGGPVSDSVVNVVSGSNTAPTLSWTGETNYTDDGVDPDGASNGSEFVFRISYADADNSPPDTPDGIQVWVDKNDDGDYLDPDEQINMNQVDAGDTDYTDGKLYTVTMTLAYGSDRNINYCFFASDGTDVATGTPVFDHSLMVTSDEVLPSMVGLWKFEESGTTAFDETLNINNGTISGAAQTGGRVGNGLSFDGTDDNIIVPDSSSLDITEAITMEAWVKIDSYPTEWNLILFKGNYNTNRNYGMWVRNTGDILVSFRSGDWYSFYPTGQGFTTGEWHHVVGIIDTVNDYRAIYIDGELIAFDDSTIIPSLTANGNPLYMGSVDAKFPLDGILDEVVIYNRVLTESEIKERYGAWLKAAKAGDTSGGGDGIQTGDQVFITFDGETNGATVDASNIDTVLSLSNGHTWKDGSGSIGSAVWSTDTNVNDTLTITLSTNSGAPTVSVRDTITLDGTIKDAGLGRSILDSVFLIGSFDVDFVIPEDAVGFWRFDAGEGSTANDETSNFNDGSITGAVWTTEGRSGNGLSFDGSGDSVDAADDASLNIKDELTIEMWIKPAVTYDSSLSTHVVLIDRQRSAGTDSYFLGINSDGKLHLGSSGGNIQSTRTSWAADTWYHVVGTYRDSGGSYSGELYINGVAEPLSVDSYDNMGGGSQTIGIGGSDRLNSFNGVIDEVVIYNRALTEAEVLERYSLYGP